MFRIEGEPRRAFSRLLPLLACIPLAGCGPIIAGVILSLPSSSSHDFVAFVAAPTGTFTVGPRIVTPTASITLTVSDQQSTNVTVTEIDLDPGTGSFTGPATITSPSLPATVAATANGTPITFTWNAQADLGTSAHKNVRFQAHLALTGASSSVTAVVAMSAGESFIYGNDAPVVSNVATIGNGGNIVITYDLADSTGDTTSLKVTFSAPSLGGGQLPLTSIDAGTLANLSLPSSGASIPLDFTWNTIAETSAPTGTSDLTGVVITITPTDSFGATGPSVSSAPFNITNRGAPSVVVVEPAANPDVNGPIGIELAVLDPLSVPVDVILQWEPVGGAFPGVNDLVASPGLRAQTISDPDLRAARHILTPRFSSILDAACIVSSSFSTPPTTIVLQQTATTAALTSSVFAGATLELLSDTGAVDQTATIVSVDAIHGRLGISGAPNPAAFDGQRIRVIQPASRLYLGLSSSTQGTLHHVAWDAPRDVGPAYGANRYTIQATVVDGTLAGRAFTTITQKQVVVDRLSFPQAGSGTLATGNSPFWAASADIFGQGEVDLVSADTGSNQLSVFGSSGTNFATTGGFTTSPEIIPTGVNPVCVVAADLNGDGSTDLVSADQGSNQLSVFMGQGFGGFQSPTTISIASPGQIVAADVNHDGNVDLAVLQANTQQISVFLGNGDGTFQSPIIVMTPGEFDSGLIRAAYEPQAIALADLDGDGNLDLVVLSLASIRRFPAPEQFHSVVYVFLGDGLGGFTPTSASPFAVSVVGGASLAVADMTGDGLPDLVLGGFDASGLLIYPGLGGGTFNTSTPISVPTIAPVNALFVADMNGDGIQDVVVTDSANQVEIILGAGGGAYAPAVASPIGTGLGSNPVFALTADFNEDGIPDLAVVDQQTNEVQVFLGNGDGGYTNGVAPFPADGGTQAMGLGVSDVNGDGVPDLVIADPSTNGVDVYTGVGDGSFVSVAQVSSIVGGNCVTLADLNGDGVPDLLAGDMNDQQFLVYLGTGNGQFQPAGLVALTGIATQIAVADLNGDGIPDLALIASQTAIPIFLGNGDGTFRAPAVPFITTSVDGIPVQLAIGDLNGDGIPDVAVSEGSQQEIFLGNGDGSFRSTPAILGAGSSMAIGDVNGDGVPDLVIAQGTTLRGLPKGFLDVYTGNGDGTFSLYNTVSCEFSPSAVTVADVNGDGTLDLVSGNSMASTVEVFLGAGDGTFSEPVASPIPIAGNGPSAIAVADLNLDGNADIVVAGFASTPPQAVPILLGGLEGPASFSASGEPRPASPSSGTGIGGALSLGAGVHRMDTTAGTIDGAASPAFVGRAFHFTTIDIQAKATLLVTGAYPLTLLATSDVSIVGTLVCDGASITSYTATANVDGGPGASGGPGGGAGGGGASAGFTGGSAGRGSGGGSGGVGDIDAFAFTPATNSGGGGGYATIGVVGSTSAGVGIVTTAGRPYGSASIPILVGGSGGGGGGTQVSTSVGGGGGGGGGGGLRITSAGNIVVSGKVTANGGNGGKGNAQEGGNGGGGSGGTILLEAQGTILIQSGAVVSATGGIGATSTSAPAAGSGSVGRIRFETPTGLVNDQGTVSPSASVGALP